MFGAASCSRREPATSNNRQLLRFETNFGDEILLEDYSVAEKDGRLGVEFHWRALLKPSADYRMFLHALGKDGKVAFGFNHKLVDHNGMPTSSWYRGEQVTEFVETSPRKGAPPAKYTLRIGLMTGEPRGFVEVKRSDLRKPMGAWRHRSVLLPDIEFR